MKKFLGFFLIAVAGGAVSLGLFKAFEKKPAYVSSHTEPIRFEKVSYTPGSPMNLPDFEAAASLSVHAVVHIKSEFRKKSLVYDDFFELFNFRSPSQREYFTPYTAVGSGVIVSPEGYIVTNNHVVQDAHEITVTLNDKRVYTAKVRGSDPSTDLALIKIDEKDLPFMPYGNSDNVKIGEWVLAVGNPFNLTSTVTAGIVSAKARNINILGSQGAIESFIQTDAAVNPGNSGGALVNTTGELIGINAAIASGTGYYTGYSFAIPVNIVKKVVDDFMKYGKIQRAYLGVYYKEIDDQFAKDNNLTDLHGIYIDNIVDGGAADKAGIQKGDIILSIDNQSINGKSELLELVGQKNPGEKVEIVLNRDGKKITVPVVLQGETSNLLTEGGDQGKIIIHGGVFEPLTPAQKSKFRLDHGFQLTQLNKGRLQSAGIREGFIIVAVDQQPVRTVQELRDALTKERGGIVIEGVYPNGMKVYYGIGT